MKKMIMNITAALAAGLAAMLAVTGCSDIKGLDVVGKQSVASFDEVLKAIPDKVAADEINAGWSLEAPDAAALFVWSGNYSKSPQYDVIMEFCAEPFEDAGLDVSKLPDTYSTRDCMLGVGVKLGDGALTYNGNPTPLAAYEQLVNEYRDSVGYHMELDHYNVKLGDGNAFEWAKDMAKNGTTGENQDLDIVFVLNPDPLIAAGVDPANVEGWVFSKVEMMGESVDKFLKPFNLK